MATIEKRGNSYRITVSQGYDLNGKQIRAKMTWTPEPGMTARQIQKELTKQAVLFEEKAKHIQVQDGNIRFAAYVDLFLTQYADKKLKATTAEGYRKRAKQVVPFLGHLRLSDIKPGHLNSLYALLQEEGQRTPRYVKGKDSLYALFTKRGTCLDMIKKTGLSQTMCYRAKTGGLIMPQSAEKIAAYFGTSVEELFEPIGRSGSLSENTVRSCHDFLLSAFQRAVKWGYIESNPAQKAEAPGSNQRSARGHLDEPDVQRLLNLLQEESVKWAAPIKFDLFTGLRRGELLGLRWCDVDMDARVIYVRQTWNYVAGVGHYVDTPKTPTSERAIKVSAAAISVLLEVIRWQEECKNRVGDNWNNEDDRIFTNEHGCPLSPGSLTRWFGEFLREHGFAKNVSLHSLRHTYASLMIANGIPLTVVSHQLGHTQIGTTCNIYSHVIASAEAKAAEIFDRFETPSPSTIELPTKEKTVG